MSSTQRIVYVTSSAFKREENAAFLDLPLNNGTPVRDLFTFQFREIRITETLEVDLDTMVRAEVLAAYAMIKVPCIVEHAGLIFEGQEKYPGGLTKPMWNALGDRFVSANMMAGRGAVARAVVGYCDGMAIHTFVGETPGTLIDPPRGASKFYWDRVFVPDGGTGKTYAEIVEDPSLGLSHKMGRFSQSAKAMHAFLEFRGNAGVPKLWR